MSGESLEYEFTPDDARPIADSVYQHFRNKGYKVFAEKAINDDAKYVTTLFAKKNSSIILVEAQVTHNLTNNIRRFAEHLKGGHVNVEFYLAVDDSSSMDLSDLRELKRLGVGLFIIKDSDVELQNKAINPAYFVSIAPNLNYGKYKTEIKEMVEKFNEGNRKDALRDLCELGEKLTDTIISKADSKGIVNVSHVALEKLDWSNQIDILASSKNYVSGDALLVDKTMKADLDSFRVGRNLFDHKTKTKAEELRRQNQYLDKMGLGLRVSSELVTIVNRLVKRKKI